MSSKIQNLKRALYFRLADYVWSVSNQFGLEWDRMRKQSFLYRLVFRGDIAFDRIGLNLDRMRFVSKKTNRVLTRRTPIIFLGRINRWKGFDKFCEIVNSDFGDYEVVVFTSPAIHADVFNEDFFSKEGRHLVYAKGITDYLWPNSAIHFYPSFYTKDVLHPMSISLNVLECVYLGIPSLISHENFESWPELKDSILCLKTNWKSSELRRLVTDLQDTPKQQFQSEAIKLREILSIEPHCTRLINKFELN